MRLLMFFAFIQLTSIYGQDLHNQMLSAQGSSQTLTNGMYVSQTIGQQSVIVIYDGTNFQFLNPPSSGNNQPTDFNSLIYTTRGF